MQVNIKDSSVLDEVKIIFKDSLQNFSANIHSHAVKYNKINEDAQVKASDIQYKIATLDSDIRRIQSRISALKYQEQQARSNASSHSNLASQSDSEEESNHHSSQANYFNSMANEYSHQASFESRTLMDVQDKLSRERNRMAEVKSIQKQIQLARARYDQLLRTISYSSDDIFEQTSKKVAQIKNSIEEYTNIQSNRISNHNSSDMVVRSQKHIDTKIVQEIVATETSFINENFVFNDAVAIVNSEKKNKKVKIDLEYQNETIVLCLLNKKENINILSIRGDVSENIFSCVIAYVEQEAKKMNMKSMIVYIDEKDVQKYLQIGFEVIEKYDDGIEVKKDIL